MIVRVFDNVVKKIMEIEDGQIIEYSGNYSRYMTLKTTDTGTSKNHELQQKEIKRLKGMIRRYRQWGMKETTKHSLKSKKKSSGRLRKVDTDPSRLKVPAKGNHDQSKKICRGKKC